jgi:predicted GNAT family N-acyltransferase
MSGRSCVWGLASRSEIQQEPHNSGGNDLDNLRIERFTTASTSSVESEKWLSICHRIRRLVFIDEQGVPPSLELDGQDARAEHFILFKGSGPSAIALGTARLRQSEGYASAERVAVVPNERGRGHGRMLMEALEQRAISLGQPMIRLSAQLSALPFYETMAYKKEGEPYVKAGLDHQDMTKAIA